MRRTMVTMSDEQYNALVASRSGGGHSGVSSRLLPPSQGAQYLSQKLYGDRVDPYHPAAVGSGLGGSATPYPSSANRAAGENYPDPKEMRVQLAADRRGGGLLPSPTLVDYSPTTFVDHVGSRGVLPVPTVSSEVVGAYHRGGQVLSNAELLAARARRSELAASYQSGYASEVPVRRTAPASYDDPGLLQAPAAGILGPGGVRRSQELDRYLLSVQPEKLVRYASSILEPATRRNSYPATVENDLSPDDDMYSNYRRAKARRMGVPEFGARGEPPSRRDRDGEVSRYAEHYRERRGRESSRELGRRSPDRRRANGSSSKGNDANRVDRPNNASQSSGGRRGQQNAGQSGGSNKRSRYPEKMENMEKVEKVERAEKVEKGAGAKGKVEDPNSDKDSELGSLCADLSDSDEEKVEKKSEEAATVIDGPLAGMIFGCSSATFHECMRLQLFGLPPKSKDDVLRVTPGTKVFLFNFDTKELSGIFEAVSHGGWQIQPDAFRDFGGFPAQVQVCCSEQCPNIPQSVFRAAIKDNYVSSTRFRFDLNTKQVRELVRIFRQTAGQLPRQLQDPVTDRYLSARVQPEEYIARGGPQQQRPYARHPQARFGTSRVVPYDDARVMMISMSANKTTNIRKRSKRRASKRKKRKVSATSVKPESPPLSPMADNCSLYSLSGERVEGADDLGDDDETSNPNSGVIVFRDGVDTGRSRNVVHQPKEIVETLSPAVKGIAPPSGLSPSKPPEEFPQPQSNLGKQEVSFLEDDSYNDGNFRLAGSRADDQGQGFGHDVPLQGALSSGNVIKSSGCTLSSMGEGLSTEVQGVVSITTGLAEVLMNLGGNNTPSEADCDRQLSELENEKTSLEGSGDNGIPTHEKSRSSESICSDLIADEKLRDVHTEGVFMETVEEEADCTLLSVGKDDEELEEIAAEVAIGPEAPFIRMEMMVAAADIGICPEDACIREDVMVAAEFAADSGDSLVIEEVMIAAAFVCKRDDLGVIAAEVATDSEACVDARMVIAGFAGKDESELTGMDSGAPTIIEEATVAIHSGDPVVIEKATGASAIVGKEDEELVVLAAEVAIDPKAPIVIEEATIASGIVGKDDEELFVLAAEVAIDSEDPVVIEEATVASAIVGKDDEELVVLAAEVAIDPKIPIVIEEATVASAIVGKDDEKLRVLAAEVAIDREAPIVIEEATIASAIVGEDDEKLVLAAEVAIDPEAPTVIEEATIAAAVVAMDDEEVVIDSEAPCVRAEEVMIAAEVAVNSEIALVRDSVMASAEAACEDEVERLATAVAIDSEAAVDAGAPFDRNEVMISVEAVDHDEKLEIAAHEVALESDPPMDREEEIINAESVGNEETLEVIAGEAPCALEEVMIAAQALRSQLLASADMDDIVTTDDDEGHQAEDATLAVDSADSDQPPSPNLNVLHGDNEDEESLPAPSAVTFELATSSDEGEDEDEDEKEGLPSSTVAAKPVDSDQPPSPDLNVTYGDDEDESEEDVPSASIVYFELATSSDEDEDVKEGLPAANAVDFELASSSSKDEDEGGVPAATAADFELATSSDEDEYQKEGRPAENAVDFELAASPNKDEDEQEGLPAANAIDFELAATPNKDEDEQEGLPAANAVDFELAASPNKDEGKQEGLPAASSVDFELVASPNRDEDEKESPSTSNDGF